MAQLRVALANLHTEMERTTSADPAQTPTRTPARPAGSPFGAAAGTGSTHRAVPRTTTAEFNGGRSALKGLLSARRIPEVDEPARPPAHWSPERAARLGEHSPTLRTFENGVPSRTRQVKVEPDLSHRSGGLELSPGANDRHIGLLEEQLQESP